MRALKGILQESLSYYEQLERNLLRRLARLPEGSVKRRRIKGRTYYYVQRRVRDRVLHRYLGRGRPDALIKAVKERQLLRRELAKVRAALRLLPKRKLRA